MVTRRRKSLASLKFCVFVVLFVLLYITSDNVSKKMDQFYKENIIGDREIKPLNEKDSYVKRNANPEEMIIIEKHSSIGTEHVPKLLNYDLINEIEYIDYRAKDDTTDFNVMYTKSNTISLKHLFSVCVNAVKAGGLQLRSVRRNFDLKNILGVKPTNIFDNPVTIGRSLSHLAIVYTLRNSFPNIKLVSSLYNGFKIEPYEKKFQIHNVSDDVLVPLKNILVWLDPLDAEYEYHSNYLEYVSTMICVAVAGKPIIGVIHQPFENFTKWGWVGKGVSNSSFPLAYEPGDVSRPLTVAVSPAQANKMKFAARIAFHYPINIVAANGAGYKSLQLMEGRADAYLHVAQIDKWKTCAGNALINAINGKMTTLSGVDIDYGDPKAVKNKLGLVASVLYYDIFFNLGIVEPESYS